jgi:hypothetical protein
MDFPLLDTDWCYKLWLIYKACNLTPRSLDLATKARQVADDVKYDADNIANAMQTALSSRQSSCLTATRTSLQLYTSTVRWRFMSWLEFSVNDPARLLLNAHTFSSCLTIVDVTANCRGENSYTENSSRRKSKGNSDGLQKYYSFATKLLWLIIKLSCLSVCLSVWLYGWYWFIR